ncbi:MAG TPA: NAD(P)-dependent oxidoreductase [Xanthobacteraceae bacterium]|nr:NAD(P)-dependent oxidoreductase [Xanthobacteraceae bacterium]
MVNSKRVFYVVPHAPVGYVEALSKRPDITLEALAPDCSETEAARVLAEAHAYQTSSTRDELPLRFHTTADLLKRAPNLLIVSANGAGYDTVDAKACTEAGVLVLNQTGGNKEAVAEHVLGMMLALSKRIIETDRALRAGRLSDRNAFMGADLVGKTVGVVGLGNVGSRVAELCRGLFRMRVLACDPYLSAEEVKARGAEKVSLDALLSRADFVSINCPLTEETRGMIGAREYALMRPHAYFITTARGFIHDEAALAEALQAKRIAGAGLDVWSKEPPTKDHPLLKFDNVIVSAHNAGVTAEARINMGRFAAESMLDALDGKRPARIVNPEVWPHYAARFEKTFGVRPG